MKTKEIIKEADIQNGAGFKKQEKFFAIMVNELESIYNSFGQKDSEHHFKAATKQLRIKWDSISRQIRYGLPDKLWNYFYATEVIKKKRELCVTWAEKQEREHQKYLARQKKHEEKRAEFDRQMREEYDEE